MHNNARWAAEAKMFHKLREYVALISDYLYLQAVLRENEFSRIERQLVINRIERKHKKLNSVSKSIDYWAGIFMGKKPRENDITEAMIDIARSKPLTDFVEVNHSGMCKCYFHSPDNKPSMKVYADGYHCFACGAKGDVIDFVMRTQGCKFPEAVRRLQ